MTNPLARVVKRWLKPRWAVAEDPANPGRMLVMMLDARGRPDWERISAVLEKGESLDVFSPIFRRSPAPLGTWNRAWDLGVLGRLADSGGREQAYYCPRIEPEWKVPAGLVAEGPRAVLRTLHRHHRDIPRAAVGNRRAQSAVENSLLRELKILWYEALMQRSAKESSMDPRKQKDKSEGRDDHEDTIQGGGVHGNTPRGLE